jgi:hypothetical protein
MDCLQDFGVSYSHWTIRICACCLSRTSTMAKLLRSRPSRRASPSSPLVPLARAIALVVMRLSALVLKGCLGSAVPMDASIAAATTRRSPNDEGGRIIHYLSIPPAIAVCIAGFLFL